MIVTMETMPTELIWKDPNRLSYLRVINSKEYKELMARYTDTLHTLDMCMETLDSQDAYIRELESSRKDSYNSDDYEHEVTENNNKPEKTEAVHPKTKRKFAGATLQFDPFRKSLGIGLHFKSVTKY